MFINDYTKEHVRTSEIFPENARGPDICYYRGNNTLKYERNLSNDTVRRIAMAWVC
jgi:hypothetical protein